jgi:aminoglycoside phosphotransferase (APT) family kinase protein
VELERSPRWLGVPFLVTRFADGLVAGDSPPYLLDPNGWFRKGSPEQWQRFEHATIDVIARLHRIPGDDAATAFLLPKAAGDSLLAQHLAEHHAYYDWARDGHVIPVLERAYAALAKTLPRNARRVLNWGDSRPGNILYRDFEPVLVLDWEMASGGPPELDIAWLTFFQKFYAGMGARYGVQVPAMFGHAETRAIYERLAGEKLGDLTWYEALAGYRFGIIVARMMLRSAAFGQQPAPADPDELVIFKPLLEELVAAL